MTENKLRESVCGLCELNQSKYCCPRCNVFYCSLDCYKSEKHTECSEDFYRDCVNEELASQHAGDESRKKMVDILKRMHDADLDDTANIDELLNDVEDEEVDSDDDKESDLHERVKDLNLDDPNAIWSVLSQDEKNEFEALLNNGDVGSIIPHWEPWWTFRKEQKLVEAVNESDKLEKHFKNCPQVKDVPKLNLLTSLQPSPAIRFNIINVMASYAFTTRYFNGEIEAEEAVCYILNICANLDTNTNFEDAVTAIESVAQKCLQSELIQTDEISLNVMRTDSFLILQGPSKENKMYYCKAALSHLHSILSEVKNNAKSKIENKNPIKKEFSKKFPEHTKEHLPKLDICKVKKCLKKIEYYLSYIDSGNAD